MTPLKMAQIHEVCFTTPRPWSEAEIADLAASPLCFVACADDGFAILRKAGPEAELLTIAVHPNAQRKGTGAKLLSTMLTEAKNSGCEDVFLEVVASNAPAISLYHGAGFEDLNYRKGYYSGPDGEKVTALVMHKPI